MLCPLFVWDADPHQYLSQSAPAREGVERRGAMSTRSRIPVSQYALRQASVSPEG